LKVAAWATATFRPSSGITTSGSGFGLIAGAGYDVRIGATFRSRRSRTSSSATMAMSRAAV